MNVKFSPVEEGCFRENIHKGANDELKSKATEEETLMHAFNFVLNENNQEPRNKLSLPEKRPKQKSAAEEPGARADDILLLALRIYSHCGTCAGTHTAARRGGRVLDLKH